MYIDKRMAISRLQVQVEKEDLLSGRQIQDTEHLLCYYIKKNVLNKREAIIWGKSDSVLVHLS